MLIKINGGTTGGTPLCYSCAYLWRRKMDNNQEVLRCGYEQSQVEIKRPVLECSKYRDVVKDKHDSFWKTAWILDVSKSGIPLGFIKNIKFRQDHPDDEDLSWR